MDYGTTADEAVAIMLLNITTPREFDTSRDQMAGKSRETCLLEAFCTGEGTGVTHLSFSVSLTILGFCTKGFLCK